MSTVRNHELRGVLEERKDNHPPPEKEKISYGAKKNERDGAGGGRAVSKRECMSRRGFSVEKVHIERKGLRIIMLTVERWGGETGKKEENRYFNLEEQNGKRVIRNDRWSLVERVRVLLKKGGHRREVLSDTLFDQRKGGMHRICNIHRLLGKKNLKAWENFWLPRKRNKKKGERWRGDETFPNVSQQIQNLEESVNWGGGENFPFFHDLRGMSLYGKRGKERENN